VQSPSSPASQKKKEHNWKQKHDDDDKEETESPSVTTRIINLSYNDSELEEEKPRRGKKRDARRWYLAERRAKKYWLCVGDLRTWFGTC
jgi:hypothetical protein